MPTYYTASSPFKMLVANLYGGTNTVLRSVAELQLFHPIHGSGPTAHQPVVQSGLVTFTTPDTFVRPSCVVTVASNTFTSKATLVVGPYLVSSGVDFTPGGSVNDTATALAAAIDGLPGFSAAAVADEVTIEGSCNPSTFYVSAIYAGSVKNFDILPSNNFSGRGEPYLGPISVT